MRRYIKQVGCVMIVLSFALLGAPAVQADNASFVNQARAIGFKEVDDVLIRMALSACRFLQPHLRRHPFEVEAHITRYANLEPATIPAPHRGPAEAPDAHQFLILAVHEYCPELAYRIPV